MSRYRDVEHPERLTTLVDVETGKLVRQFATEYNVDLSTVVNKALLLYFQFSGYSATGYDVTKQRRYCDDFNVLDEPLLLQPPAPLVACTMSTSSNNGMFSDDVACLVQSNEYDKARAKYLGGDDDEQQ